MNNRALLEDLKYIDEQTRIKVSYHRLEGTNYSDSEYEDYNSVTSYVYGKGISKIRVYEKEKELRMKNQLQVVKKNVKNQGSPSSV